jgi:hypothetical protein
MKCVLYMDYKLRILGHTLPSHRRSHVSEGPKPRKTLRSELSHASPTRSASDVNTIVLINLMFTMMSSFQQEFNR